MPCVFKSDLMSVASGMQYFNNTGHVTFDHPFGHQVLKNFNGFAVVIRKRKFLFCVIVYEGTGAIFVLVKKNVTTIFRLALN